MKPTRAQVAAEGPARPAFAPNTSAGLKEFAGQQEAKSEEAGKMFVFTQPDFYPSKYDAVTDDDMEFFFRHEAGHTYALPEAAFAAEERYDEIRHKLFRTYTQFKRDDGAVPEVEYGDFMKLTRAYLEYDVAFNHLRPARKGETPDAYIRTLDPKPAFASELKPFAPAHDFRTEPLAWATDYTEYLDRFIAWAQVEIERWFDARGLSREERDFFWHLEIEAAHVMRDLGHPGASSPAIFPDIQRHIMPLLDAADDILLTKAHRAFKLAPEQELDVLADFFASRNTVIVEQHLEDAAATFSGLRDFSRAFGEATNMQETGPKAPLTPRSRARAEAQKRIAAEANRNQAQSIAQGRGAVGGNPAAEEMLARLPPLKIPAPTYDEQAFRTSAAAFSTGMERVDILRRSKSLIAGNPLMRIAMGMMGSPVISPIEHRIEERWAELPGILRAQKRSEADVLIAEEMIASVRSTDWTRACSSVVLDLLLAGTGGALYWLFDSVTKSRAVEAGNKIVDSHKHAVAAGDAALRKNTAGVAERLIDFSKVIDETFTVMRRTEALNVTLIDANLRNYTEWRANVTAEVNAAFPSVQELGREYIAMMQTRTTDAVRRDLKLNPRYSDIISEPKDPTDTAAREAQLVEKLAKNIVDYGLKEGSERRKGLVERLAPVEQKGRANALLSDLVALEGAVRRARGDLNDLTVSTATLDESRSSMTKLLGLVASSPVIKGEVSCASREQCADNGGSAVAEVHVAYQYLAANALHLMARIESRRVAEQQHTKVIETGEGADYAQLVRTFSDFARVRGWDVSEFAETFSARQVIMIDTLLDARDSFSELWKTNDAVLISRMFAALDSAFVNGTSTEIVLPFSGGSTLLVTQAVARSVNEGKLEVPEGWSSQVRTADEINADTTLREIKLGDITLRPKEAQPVHFASLWAQLDRLAGTWKQPTALAAERSQRASFVQLETGANASFAVINKLLDNAYVTNDEALSANREAMDQVSSMLARVSIDLRRLLYDMFGEMEKVAQTVGEDYAKIAAQMFELKAVAGYGEKISENIAPVLASILTEGAVWSGFVAEPDRAAFLATNRDFMQRFMTIYMGDTLNHAQNVFKTLQSTVASPVDVAERLRVRANETIIQDATKQGAIAFEVTFEGLWKHSKQDFDALVETGPEWMKHGSLETFKDLPLAQRRENSRWAYEKLLPKIAKYVRSEHMRSVFEFKADARVREEGRKLRGWVDAKIGPRSLGALDMASKIAIGDIFAKNIGSIYSMQQSISGAASGIVGSSVWTAISSGQASIFTIGAAAELLKSASPPALAMLLSWASSGRFEPDAFFQSFAVNLSEAPAWSAQQFWGLASTFVAIAGTAGMDLWRHQTNAGAAIGRILSGSASISAAATNAMQSMASASTKAASHAAMDPVFAALQQKAERVDRNARVTLKAFERVRHGGRMEELAALASPTGWRAAFHRMRQTNSIASIAVGVLGVAAPITTWTYFALADVGSGADVALRLGAGIAAGVVAPVCYSLARRFVTADSWWDKTKINLASGSVGSRWTLVKLMGNAGDMALLASEIAMVEQTDEVDPYTGRLQERVGLRLLPGDTPFERYRRVNVTLHQRWEDLQKDGDRFNAFMHNALTPDERAAWYEDRDSPQGKYALETARTVFVELVRDMEVRDKIDQALIGFRRVGSFWTRTGLAIVPTMVRAMMPGDVMAAEAVTSAIPQGGGAGALMSISLALGRSLSRTSSWSAQLAQAIVGYTFAAAVRGLVFYYATPAVRVAANFALMMMQSVTLATAINELYLKLESMERADKSAVSEFTRTFIDLVTKPGQEPAQTERTNKIADIKKYIISHAAEVESVLLEANVSGAKTSYETNVRAWIVLGSWMAEMALWSRVVSL